MSETATMTLTDFLFARFDEAEKMLSLGMDSAEYLGKRLVDGQAFVAADFEAKRRIVGRYEQAERLCAANAGVHAEASSSHPLDRERITALRTHGWELAGRRDGLRYAVTALALPYADHPDYRDEWRA